MGKWGNGNGRQKRRRIVSWISRSQLHLTDADTCSGTRCCASTEKNWHKCHAAWYGYRYTDTDTNADTGANTNNATYGPTSGPYL